MTLLRGAPLLTGVHPLSKVPEVGAELPFFDSDIYRAARCKENRSSGPIARHPGAILRAGERT
jgi:hypothetical protein